MIKKSALELVKSLNLKSKIQISKISENLNWSRNTVKSKLQSLIDSKVVENFSIIVNPNILNQDYIFIFIKTNPQESQILTELKKIPQVVMIDGIFGEYSLITKCVFNTKDEFNEMLRKFDLIISSYSKFKKYRIVEAIKIYKINGINLIDKSKINIKFDDIDYEIIRVLKNQKFKYQSTYDISKKLKNDKNIEISQSAVYKRIKYLEDNNVILRYVIKFYPKLIDYHGKFILMLKPKDPREYEEFASSILQKYREIKEIYRTGEVFALLCIVRVQEIEDYGKLLLDLYKTNKIEDTYSYFILDEQYPTSFPIE